MDRLSCDVHKYSLQRTIREQKDTLLDSEKLDSARKRLQENYQEAQNGNISATYLACLPLIYRLRDLNSIQICVIVSLICHLVLQKCHVILSA